MMQHTQRHQHCHNIADQVSGKARGMQERRHGPKRGRGGCMGRGRCREEDDARRSWLEARKQRLQARLAEVEAELAALDQTGVS